MNKNKNIEYTLKKLDRCYKQRQAIEIEQGKYENRLAKIVIAHLYQHNRKKLEELDRSPFGMAIHNSKLNNKERDAAFDSYIKKNGTKVSIKEYYRTSETN